MPSSRNGGAGCAPAREDPVKRVWRVLTIAVVGLPLAGSLTIVQAVTGMRRAKLRAVTSITHCRDAHHCPADHGGVS